MDKDELTAPCGIDCSHCSAYLNEKYDKIPGKVHSRCIGCRAKDKKCAFLKQKCELLRNKKVDFCYQCPDFPCEQLKKLNSRYEKRGYGMNFTENNLRIKEIGLKKFKEEQNKKYSCPECGGEVSIHEKICYVCGYKSS